MEPSLERITPDDVGNDPLTGTGSLDLHLERYRFAANLLAGGRVLDIACGTGYGARLIADSRPDAETIIGVDICADTIAYARARYGKDGIEFCVADANSFENASEFDCVVSLETIEHLPEPSRFVRNMTRSLRPDGLFIASVPITPTVDSNPHHQHDFTAKSFRKLLANFDLEEVTSLEQVQQFNPVSVIARRERRLKDMRPNLISYYVRNPSALIKRVHSTITDGFRNQYLTIVSRR